MGGLGPARARGESPVCYTRISSNTRISCTPSGGNTPSRSPQQPATAVQSRNSLQQQCKAPCPCVRRDARAGAAQRCRYVCAAVVLGILGYVTVMLHNRYIRVCIRVCNGRRTNPWGADLRLEISNLEIASCEVVFEPQRCLLVLVEPTHNILLLLVIWWHQQGRSQVVMQHRAPTPRQQHQHSKEG